MQLKKIALACAAALALPMTAHAVAPANAYDTAGAMTVFLSGASAPDNFLATIMSGMLKPGFYQYTAGANYRLFLGELAATNQKVVFVKRSEGGSVFGVNPIGLNSPLKTMILNSTVCPTAAIAGGAAASCNSTGVNSAIVGIDPGFAGAPGAAVPADFGVSDVAPFMFKEPFNVEFGRSQLAGTSNLTIKGVNTLAMGIVTTKDVPETLKINQADYHAMLTANVFDWNTLGAGIPIATDKKTQVVVCRRVPGSGTQTSYNWYFNQFPCTANSGISGGSGNTIPSRLTDSAGYGVGSLGLANGSSAANAIGVDVTAGYTVIENSGSGDVRACLKAAAENTAYSFKDEAGLFHLVNFNTVPVGHTAATGWRAIGVLSLDSQTNTSTTAVTGGSESAWFFRPQNGNGRFYQNGQTCLVGATLAAPNAVPAGGTPASGSCPNQANLRSGDYDFAAELTMQYRTGAVKDTFDAARLAFMDDFISRAGAPALQALWTMALPGGTFVPDGTNAVSFASRQGNQCGPLVRGTF